MHAVTSIKSNPRRNSHADQISPVPGESSILIVASSRVSQDTLSRQLIHNGYAVATVNNTEAARKLSSTQPFDLILIDVCGKETDGYQLCRWLKDREGYKDIPVIIIGDSTEPKVKAEAFNCGCVDYLARPVQMEELCARTQSHIRLYQSRCGLENKNKELQQGLKKELRLRKKTEAVLNTRIQQQESAAEISRMMLSDNNLEELLQIALHNISVTLSAESCTILQLLPNNALLLRAGHGWLFGEVGKLTIRLDQESPIALTVKQQEPVIFYDLNKDNRFKHLKLIMKDYGVASGVSVVIKNQTGLWGTLSVHSREKKHFSDDDVKYLQVVAKILADTIGYISSFESLQQSEEKFRGLLESAPDGMLISNNEGRITMVNAALEKLAGYQRDELIGQQVEVLVPVRFKNHIALRQEYINHPKSRAVHERGGELFVRHKSGKEIPVEISLNPLMTNEGIIISVNIRDITERKQAFETLKYNEELLRSYFNSGLIGMTISKPDGAGWLQINDTYCRMMGYTREELMGMKWTDITHPDDVEMDVTSHHATLMAGEIDNYTKDKRFIRKDGSILYASISVTCKRNDDGSHKYNIVFINDISARKQAEVALRKSERQLLEAQHLASLGFWELDLMIDKLYWSDELYLITGLDPETFELNSENVLNIIHPEDRENYRQFFSRVKQEGKITHFEHRVVLGNGEIRHHNVQAELIRFPDGSPMRMLGTVMDITERKQTEDALRKNRQRLKEAQKIARLGYWEMELGSDDNYWSDELYVILGLDPEATTPSHDQFMNLVHPDDRPGVLQHVQENLQGEGQQGNNYRIIRPDGEVHHLYTLGGVERDGTGKPVRSYATFMDITVIRQAEEALRQSELRLKEAQKIARLGYWERNLITGESFWSDEIFEIMGLDPEISRSSEWSIIDIVHPDDKQDVQAVIDNNLSGNTSLAHDYRIVRPDGKVRHIYTVGGAEKNEDGKPMRVFATFMDITERKQAQQALAQSEERLRRFFDAGLVGMTVASLEKGLLQFNDKYCEITGYRREELENMSWMDITHPDDRDEEAIRFKRVNNGEKEGFTRNKRYVRNNGEIIHVMVSTECIRKPDGAVDYFVSFVQDITEMKQAEEDLRQARDELELRVQERTAELLASKEYAEKASAIGRITLESMDQGLIMVNKDNEITIYNDKLADYLGFDREKVMACRSYDDYLLLGRSKMGEEAFTRLISTSRARENISYEITVGEDRTLEVRQNPLQRGGFVRTYTDITRIKEIQEDLRQAKVKAEMATVAKANFLAAMSHEIRTPMNGVIGMADLLQQSRLNEEQKEMLEIINDCGHSLLTIINDILDYSKIEADRLELEKIPVLLEDVVEGAARTIVHGAIRKGLRLLTYVDPDLPQYVIGDPVRLRQILINLGGNAIKFTEKGQILIRADLVAKGKNNVTARFSVIDEGIGIARNKQNLLFREFSQVDASTTRKYGGTGLGLSICQRLVEMMSGEIGVHSSPGKGSEFFLTLLFKRSNKVRNYSTVSDLAGLRILLVVTDTVEAEIYRSYLEHWHAGVEINTEITACKDLCLSAVKDGLPYDIVITGCDWDLKQRLQMSSNITDTAVLSGTRFVMMQRGRRRRPRLENESCISLDVDQLTRASFLSAVSIAAGRASPEIEYDAEMEAIRNLQPDKMPSKAKARNQGNLILVAEDNPTNRDVIRRQLSLLGYACDVVNDGAQALKAWRGSDYAIVLADCQMPNMDGFELSRAIRNDEADTGRRSRIIAITANVMKGEAERCLTAGMDDYLPKPININELRDKLRHWMPQNKVNEDNIEYKSSETYRDEPRTGLTYSRDSDSCPINEMTLKGMFGEDPDIFRQVLTDFINPTQKIIGEIRAGYKARCARDVKLASHKLKSSARSVGADKLADLCLELETAGKEENWEVIEADVPVLDNLMEEIESYINGLT